MRVAYLHSVAGSKGIAWPLLAKLLSGSKSCVVGPHMRGDGKTSPASGLTASFVRPAPAFSPSVCQRLPRLLRTSKVVLCGGHYGCLRSFDYRCIAVDNPRGAQAARLRAAGLK